MFRNGIIIFVIITIALFFSQCTERFRFAIENNSNDTIHVNTWSSAAIDTVCYNGYVWSLINSYGIDSSSALKEALTYISPHYINRKEVINVINDSINGCSSFYILPKSKVFLTGLLYDNFNQPTSFGKIEIYSKNGYIIAERDYLHHLFVQNMKDEGDVIIYWIIIN